jgi:signal transduction histidine kinase
MASLAEDVKLLVKEHGSALVVGLEPAVCLGDSARLQQVASNLVMNALRHNAGPVEIRLRIWANSRSVSLAVEDNGVGISHEEIESVFDRFFQSEPSRGGRGKDDGSGLGLAICRVIVERHGGTIGAVSEPGKKTVFTVTLPAARCNGG